MNDQFFLLKYAQSSGAGAAARRPSPMRRGSDCPPHAELFDRSLGRLTAERLTKIDAHLDSCASCNRVMASLRPAVGAEAEGQLWAWTWGRAIFRSSAVNVVLLSLVWVVSLAMVGRTLSEIDWWVAVQEKILAGGATVAILMTLLTGLLYTTGRLNKHFVVPGVIGFLMVWGGSWGYAEIAESQSRQELNSLFLGHRWVAYDPPRFNPYPETERMPTEDEMKSDLKLLHDEASFDALYTFKATGTMAEIPRLAKEVGFRRVIMGIFINSDEDGNPVRPDDQIQSAIEASKWVDGYCLGHNTSTALDIQTLARWMQELRTATGKPVTTTAPLVSYLGERGKALRQIGDWYMPDVHGSWGAGTSPRELYRELEESIQKLTILPSDKPVLLKMVSCPSAGGPAYTEESQAEFYTWLARDLELPSGVYLSYYNGMDLPWMSHELHPDDWSPGQEYVGLFTADGHPKKAVAVVRKGFPIQNRP